MLNVRRSYFEGNILRHKIVNTQCAERRECTFQTTPVDPAFYIPETIMRLLGSTIVLFVTFAELTTALLKSPEIGVEMSIPSSMLVKRIDLSRTSFYVCDEANWDGRCQWFQTPVGECLNFSLLWNDRISSFGPDPGYTCNAYM